MFNDAWRGALESAARRLPADDPEALVFYEEREDLRVAASDGELVEWTATAQRGASARTRGFHGHASNPDAGSLEALVACATDRHIPETADGGERAAEVDSAIDSQRVRAIVATAYERSTQAVRGGLTLVACHVEWIGFRQSVLVARPGSAVRADTRTSSRIRIRVVVARGAASAYAVAEQAGDASQLEPGLAERAAQRAAERLDARRASPGEQPLVFAPGVGGILVHELVGHALEGDVVGRGGSHLARVAAPGIPPNVRIVDDPRRGRAAWHVDDEGTETQPVTLLENGRITGALHDLRSSASAGATSTGHGRRSAYTEPVRPRMGCTYLDAGDDAADEVVRATRSGTFVRRMESAGTDPRSGRAFFRVTDADRIVNGRIAEPVLSFLIIADAVKTLRSIDRIANDLAFDTCIGACVRDGQPLPTSVGAPTCRLGLITAFV